MEEFRRSELHLGYDEACLSDLQSVCSSRMLKRHDASWLTRAVSGAIRPSRDRPVWDLAHTVAALGLDGRGLIDLALDPGRCTAADLQVSLGADPASDGKGLVLTGQRAWRISWHGLARVLALAEFLMTADDCAAFPTIRQWVGSGITADEAPALAKQLASQAAGYRDAHMPLAAIEKRFQKVRQFLRDQGREGAPVDDDIVAFWRSDATDSAFYTTVVEHFVTYEKAHAAMAGLSAFSGAEALDAIDNWEDRLEAVSLPIADPPQLRDVLEALASLPDGPKLLTGKEFSLLRDVLSYEPYHRTRPLTVLRAQAFGQIQSGIANRLRRGTGGASVDERLACDDADYAALADAAMVMSDHLQRCLVIAFALRSGPEAELALAQQGERELKRMRRAGFDAPRDQLAASIALVDEALATVATAFAEYKRAVERLGSSMSLDAQLTEDRAAFSDGFRTLYAEASERAS